MTAYIGEVKSAVMVILSAALSFVAPIKVLITLTLVFFLFEFITDTACHVKKKNNRKGYKKLYSAILSNHLLASAFAVIIIVSAYMLDKYIVNMEGAAISKITASIFCVCSFLSICRNSAYVCSNRAFKLVKKRTSVMVSKLG